MPEHDDEQVDVAWITTYCEKSFHLYGDDPDEIDIRDIAHALSNQCRFTGHVSRFYSVAQHSILVSDLVALSGGSFEQQRHALMHDASEAYLSDVAAPFKKEIPGYHDAEELIEKRICDKFNLAPKSDLIKECDWYALFIEADYLVNAGGKVFLGYKKYGAKAKEFDADLFGVGHVFVPELPRVAELEFLNAARRLKLYDGEHNARR